MFYGREFPNVSFNICLSVGIKPASPCLNRSNHGRLWIASCNYLFLDLFLPVRERASLPFLKQRRRIYLPEEVSQDCRRPLIAYLRPHKWVQLMKGHPACEGFGYLCEGHQVGRAGEEILSGFTILVHQDLYGTHKIGRPLDFVYYHRNRRSAYETIRVI